MKIIFDNGCDIDIIPYDNEFSHMWYEEVQSVKYNIYERDRIYGFKTKKKSDTMHCLSRISTVP